MGVLIASPEGLEEGPVAAVVDPQIVLHVPDAVDVGHVLDPPPIRLVAHLAVQGHLGVLHDHFDTAEVEAPLVLQSLDDHRPEHAIGGTAATGVGPGVDAWGPRAWGEEFPGPVHPGARLAGRTIVAFVHPSAVIAILRGMASVGAAALDVIGIVARIVRLAVIVRARPDILFGAIARAAARVVGVVGRVVDLPEVVAGVERAPAPPAPPS